MKHRIMVYHGSAESTAVLQRKKFLRNWKTIILSDVNESIYSFLKRCKQSHPGARIEINKVRSGAS